MEPKALFVQHVVVLTLDDLGFDCDEVGPDNKQMKNLNTVIDICFSVLLTMLAETEVDKVVKQILK